MNAEERSKFYVVAVVSNPVRYKSRWSLFKQFQQEMHDAGANLLVVESAFGSRPHEVTDSSDPFHVQLRTNHELWHKENMINLGIQHLAKLAPDFKYVAWVDGDVTFTAKNWIDETIQQLQHYQVVQMWQNALDLGPDGRVIHTHESFGFSYSQGKAISTGWSKYYTYAHPGFAWAATRDALNTTGGVLDSKPAILGSADHHMAWSMIGKGANTYPKTIQETYKKMIHAWEDRAAGLKRNVGYVPGTILHHWHGKKKDRQYTSRWDILTNNKFDPETDLKRDVQGLYQLVVETPRQIKLRDDIRAYMRARNEDSSDLE